MNSRRARSLAGAVLAAMLIPGLVQAAAPTMLSTARSGFDAGRFKGMQVRAPAGNAPFD